ncbi:hypothetical protein J1P26_22120 [Neobacillus sp. MM2021_6]|uniref:hypothetical protein n=1 Tax=Bacillaceae TaxID=186817 RepID=UPI001408FEB0|nr:MULTISPECIES: hypothetical protein [Bacillaceae]MBO0962402.1 hypothetical protein [Neobacillus sp. MM2021_6]NHC21029.1 hypothetical protein [Bacillus sp. MM2020_4]
MKTEVMSIGQFLHKEKEPFSIKVERHFKKYGTIYKVAGVTIILLTTLDITAFASSGIDTEARKLYKELLGIGKWIIVFKGGFDILKKLSSEDVDAAKKSFFGYLLTYLFLLGLPYGLDKVDGIFDKISTPTTGGM